MKNLVLLTACVIAILFSTQSQAQVSLGGGLLYGFDIEEVGLQLKGHYDIDEQWRGSGDLTIYLLGNEFINAQELNLNAHYLFPQDGDVQFYGIGGINIFRVTAEFGDEKESASEVGLNIGAGAMLQVSDQLNAYAELKYALSDADQLALSVGVLYSL